MMDNDEWTARVAGLIMAVIAALAIIAFAIVTSALLGPAKAQGVDQYIHDHGSGHDIYKHWHQPGGGIPCCSGRDCAPWPVEDVDPMPDGFFIRSLNVSVPMRKVLPSPDGQFHMCCRRTAPDLPCEVNPSGVPIIYCFAAPMGY